MTLEQLNENIAKWHIPAAFYSIDEGLKPDALILIDNQGLWEFFYLSERGDRSMYDYFKSSDEAYDHLWKLLFITVQNIKSTPPPGFWDGYRGEIPD